MKPSEAELTVFLSSVVEMRLFLKNDAGLVLWGNGKFLEDSPDAEGKETSGLYPGNGEAYPQGDLRTFREGQSVQLEAYQLPDGTTGHVLTWKQRLNRDGQSLILGGFIDLTRLIAGHNTELEYQATHDSLTGLINRAHFLLMMENACCQRKPRLALLFIDLDRFKAVNDLQGHIIGDQVLREVSEAISQVTRSGDVVARVGGDEFAVLLPSATATEASVLCSRLSQALSRPLPCGITQAASIGISTWREGSTPDSMLGEADTAMYAAKRSGGGCQLSSQLGQFAAPLSLLQDLEQAIIRQQLALYLQPIAQSYNRRFVGYEALVRWPTNNEVRSPGLFLPLAREAGWLPKIDWFMLTLACQHLEHFEGQYLSVNVSGPTLAESGFSDRLRQLCRDTFINPAQLNLEISEVIAIGADQALEDRVLPQLAKLQESPVAPGLFVDDFGSAFAQLQQIRTLVKNLPEGSVHALKLDASFVQGVNSDPTNMTLCRMAIETAHNLGLKAIAEGVEKEEEAITLRGLGCDCLQGYHLGLPLPVHEYLL